jgi:hypothetical protein
VEWCRKAKKSFLKVRLSALRSSRSLSHIKLNTLRLSGRSANRYTLYIGQFLLVAISMIVLGVVSICLEKRHLS